MEKTCITCGITAPTSDYHKSHSNAGGYDHSCKTCRAVQKKAYEATPVGRALRMYQGIEDRAMNRDGKHATYKAVRNLFSQASFLAWAVPLIEAFSVRHPTEVASIDRIDPYGNYEPSNCRIITWTEHRRLKKQAKKARDDARLYQYLASLQPHERRKPLFGLPVGPAPQPALPAKPLPVNAIYQGAKVGTMFLW